MGYTIFTTTQIIPATIVTPRLEGGDHIVENPANPSFPLYTTVAYTPVDYSKFSADATKRKLLLNDPAGTASASEVFTAFPGIKADSLERAREKVSRELSKSDYKVLKQVEGAYVMTQQEKADRQALRDKYTTFESSILNATDIDTVINAVFTLN